MPGAPSIVPVAQGAASTAPQRDGCCCSSPKLFPTHRYAMAFTTSSVDRTALAKYPKLTSAAL